MVKYDKRHCHMQTLCIMDFVSSLRWQGTQVVQQVVTMALKQSVHPADSKYFCLKMQHVRFGLWSMLMFPPSGFDSFHASQSQRSEYI